MAIDKIFNDGNVDGIADNIFNAVNNSVSEVKQMQQRKAAENAQMVVQSLKKIDTDIREKYDNVTTTLEKRIITIKDGRDGINGKDGRDGKNGKDGRDGKDGKTGPQGPKGQDGIDGLDGVSVVNAHIDFDGSLIIDLSTGNAINVGEVVSADLQERIKIVTSGGAGGGGGGGVTSVAATVPAFLSVAGSPITSSGTLAITLSGTALPVLNGGTGVTTSTGSGNNVLSTSPTLVTPVLGTPTSGTLSSCTVDGTNGVGYINIPQNSQSAAYTLVLADAGKHIFHPSTDANARTYTIPANSSVAYPIGTAITFINMTSQLVTIAITSDTMYLSAAGTTGSRSLAQYGSATAIKMTSTTWLISGSGLT